MVHQTITISTTKANKASSKIRPMQFLLSMSSGCQRLARAPRAGWLCAAMSLAILGLSLIHI